MARYDAFLLLSFGGPEGPDDVMPFLRNVAAGRGIPDERLAEVAGHYYQFGGVSPINGQCRELTAAIGREFTVSGPDLPMYWGNRNWHPYLEDTLRRMAADGVRRAVAVATSAYSSYSGCRQYLEDIERARERAGGSAPLVDKIGPFSAMPGFGDSFAAAARQALASLPYELRGGAELVFVAHSIPEAMAAVSGPAPAAGAAGGTAAGAAGGAAAGAAGGAAGGLYQRQLAQVAGRVAASAGRESWRLAYCSRSGPPSVPWLGPDIGDCLEQVAASGTKAAVVVPIGFVSDHMEVRHDLDVEAAAAASRLGLVLARAATPGTDGRFVRMIGELVRAYEAGGPEAGARLLGPDGARRCGPGCCGSGRPARPAGAAPAAGEAAAGEAAAGMAGAAGAEGW